MDAPPELPLPADVEEFEAVVPTAVPLESPGAAVLTLAAMVVISGGVLVVGADDVSKLAVVEPVVVEPVPPSPGLEPTTGPQPDRLNIPIK